MDITVYLWTGTIGPWLLWIGNTVNLLIQAPGFNWDKWPGLPRFVLETRLLFETRLVLEVLRYLHVHPYSLTWTHQIRYGNVCGGGACFNTVRHHPCSYWDYPPHQTFGTSYKRAHGLTHNNQIVHGDGTRWQEKTSQAWPGPELWPNILWHKCSHVICFR